MKLLRLSYIAPDWELKNLELNPVNLIVAKNATGKSMTLRIFDLMIKIVIQQGNFIDNGGRWSIEWQNEQGEVIKYIFSKEFNQSLLVSTVIEEKLLVNDIEVLVRDKNEAWIKNLLDGKRDTVYPPESKLVLHTNRDLKKYPFLEEITNWAENSYGFRFANVISSSNLNKTFFGLLNQLDDIPDLYHRLNENSCQKVIDQFNSIGYNISEIISRQKGEIITIFIVENGVEKSIPHWQLAQGMYRALSIIIFLEYIIAVKNPSIVLIDDLCEGLDYERAKKLGDLIFKKCLESEIQLVATSNDIFLMEVVDIKYWNILIRKGKTVTALNYRNNQKIFDDFRFTGLSNFDFFASDFLKQELA
jgi:putative AbiEii toxin of type IV toxin-antitoxin system